MKTKILLIGLFISLNSFSQVAMVPGYYLAKEYSKDIALYRAKQFVMQEVIGVEESLIKFDIDPLAATVSGEITSLVYHCDEKNKNGLVLGFFGLYINKFGVLTQGYAFKNLPEKNAMELLSKLDSLMELESKYLISDPNNNNMFFKYEDMTFLIYKDNGYKIRIFWNEFDAEWESVAYNRTKRRFERKIRN